MIGQLNSKLTDKMSTVTILPVSTYELDKEYTPEYDARNCIYFIPIIIWNRTPVIVKNWYDNTYDAIEGSLVTSGSDIGVIRKVRFLVNMTTGTIKVKDYHQTNLQSGSTWFINPNPVEGLGLLGIIS